MIIVTVLIALLFVLHYIYNKIKYKDINKIPGPPLKWIVGNAKEFGSNTVDSFDACQRIIKEYGSVVKLWIGPFRMTLFVTDPDMVQFFLSSNIHLEKSKKYDNFMFWLGKGLLSSGGELWRQQRKMLTPAFHFKILEQFSSIFHENLQTLIETFKKEQGRTIDVCKPISLYAMDVICETSMGITYNCQTNGESTYMASVHNFLEIHIKRTFSFLKKYDFFFKLTEDFRNLLKNVAVMHDITENIIERKKKERSSGIVKDQIGDGGGLKTKPAFLDILLDHPGLTNEEIRWQVDTFVFTGHDTVTTAMSAALYELAKYKDIQMKLLEEIYDVVGKDSSREIKLSELKQMGLLDRVVKEVIRLYPSGFLFERELTTDVTYNGMKIPANTTISFLPYFQHRDPKLFPNPELFDPDRFLPENIAKRHPYAYIPFSAGPRNCIGQRYAMMNVKTMVANIVRHFELLPSDFPHTPIIGNAGVLNVVNGFPLKLIRRQ